MSRALGRYELLRPLARGGMAEVFLARRKAAGVEKWLVVKRIRPERSGDVRFLDLFVREARLSMSLTHQNIVPVFDFGRIDDQVFLAMERVEGKDLGSTLARTSERRLPALLAAFIAAECCQALDYAHHRKSPEGAPLGIVHRDVTPRNVLLSWSGEVKLTDFGIAALAGEATSAITGTPAYMAPEQARGERLDARADVYAVGLVLRELLTGERARPGTERESTLAAAKVGTLVPWTSDAPAELVAIVDRATAPSPADRFADARAMLADLDAFIVAERAAHKGDAPARRIAAWLAAVWGEERDDGSAGDDVGADHLVSFLDDGALEVVGTGTQRSMAATAAESEPEPQPQPQPLPSPAPALTPPRRPWPLIAALSGVVALGAIAFFALRHDDAPAAPPPARVAQVTPDAALDAPPDIVVDAEIVIAPPPPPADAAAIAERPRPRKLDAAVVPAAADAPPSPAVTRMVRIQAQPWAYVTVDGDPARYETMKALPLTPGRHVIHFDWPSAKVTRDVTIDVPADRDTSIVQRLAP